jgi:HAD superfamily hydrolase (TIGR01509 family)
MSTEFRGVIFDLDGVIADSHPAHETAWRKLLLEVGHDLSGAELAALVRQGKTRSEILRTIFPHISKADELRWGNRKGALYDACKTSIMPVPGVLEWINELRSLSVPLALATSASRDRAYSTLAAFGIRNCFQAVVTASDVSAGKPDPELFVTAAASIGVEPDSILVVEDSPAGLVAAHAAGMHALFYSPDGGSPGLPLDFVIPAFSHASLVPVMQRIRASVGMPRG